MIKAIFYKEWIKSRNIVLLLLIIAVILVAYTFINNAHILRVTGAVQFWANIIDRDITIIPEFIKWFLVITALIISVTQYSLEMVNKRLKLTLHLPLSESKIIWTMQLFGLTTIVAIYLVTLCPIWFGLKLYYPNEIIASTMMQIMPFALCGLACYFFTAWVIIEPILRRRVAYFFIALAALSTFTINAASGAYIYAIPALLVIIVASVACSFFSIIRFKDGAQQ